MKKIVVIGGSGLIGTKLVHKLTKLGHQVVAASPSTGVNTITGEGLAQALVGAQVVVDVANAPSWEDKAVLAFFETSSRNLLTAEASAGVGHHVALSVVGADRLPQNGYYRAKVAQENLIKASKVPYTILRATQFFEFVGGIAQEASDGQTVRLSPAFLQPILSDDVAAALADVALGAPVNGMVELAGPEKIRLDELVRRFLRATKDTRQVITDVHARFYGSELDDFSLIPGDNAQIAPTRFEDWLSRSFGRVALVTGASSGIGAATARLLAARGMRMVVNYFRSSTAAEEVVASIKAAGGQAMAVQADVREAAEVKSMIEQVQAAWGGIDVLVHNALTPYVIKPFQDMTWKELGGKLDDEMRAAFAVTKAVLPAMTKQGWGRIIYLGTGLSRRPREGMIALGTAKAALAQFARYLAQELGPQGITVNIVEPGAVEDTRMAAVIDEEHKQQQMAATPLGRLAHPGDVAQVVAFYASEDNAFMTGTTAAVNGGMSMY